MIEDSGKKIRNANVPEMGDPVVIGADGLVRPLEGDDPLCDVCGFRRGVVELVRPYDGGQVCVLCLTGILSTTAGAKLVEDTIREADSRLRDAEPRTERDVIEDPEMVIGKREPPVVADDEWLEPGASAALLVLAFWLGVLVVAASGWVYSWWTRGA